ncbi:MAG: D-Ala-D-Ala carboxypeptidase family metallohydrolase [Chthoniobacterales bacterium]
MSNENNEHNICPGSQQEADSLPAGLLGRRRFLGILGASGATLIASSTGANAFLNVFSRDVSSEFASLDLPVEWREKLGPRLPAYAVFLKSLRLRNITVEQIIAPHMKTRRNVRCGLPPKSMWKNMAQTLQVADLLASKLNCKLVTVSSAYRSPLYNALCPGAKSNSMHLRNNALDLKYSCSPRTVARAARSLRDKYGKFSGGVGRYRTFTHIDTRGQNVDW